MRTLYIDCSMGIAGDMFTGALLDLFPEKEEITAQLNALGIPGVQYQISRTQKCGIEGTHMTVSIHGEVEGEHFHTHDQDEQGHDHDHDHDHEHEHGHGHYHEHDHDHSHDHHHEHDHDHSHDHHHDHDHSHDHHHDHDHSLDHHEHDHHGHTHTHTGMHAIEHIVWDLHLPEKVERDVLAVYRIIAEAERQVNGMPVTEIHFHEVGTMDAVADVTAVCFLLDRLGVEEIVCSPVHAGCGEVHCAHVILPVPAPATANILKGIPIYSDGTRGELTTPTGAALLKHFVNRFEAMPPMTVDSIGYGMGTKDFGKANCVRLLLGKTGQQTAASGMTGEPNENSLPDEVKELASDQDNLKDQVTELACNLDDMTAEGIGFAMDCLLEAGALDVYTIAINMKKNRPGTMLCVLTKEEKKEEMIRLLFKHTTTIGIRETMMHRSILKRETETIHTPCGTVRCKKVSGYGIERQKLEYEDLARIAREQNLSLSDVRMLVETAKAED